MAHSTHEPHLAVSRKLAEALPELFQRDVLRLWQMPALVLGGAPHIDYLNAVPFEIRPFGQGEIAAQVIRCDHAGDVDRILGGSVLRRVAELRFFEVEHRSVHLQRHRDHVDPALHPGLSEGLRAEDAAVLPGKKKLQVDRGGTRIVACMAAGMEIDLFVRCDSGAPEDLLARAGGGDGHPEDPAHRGTLHTAKGRNVGAIQDRGGGDAALAIGRAGQGHHLEAPGDQVAGLDRVADRPDGGIAGAHVTVYVNSAERSELEPGFPSERGLGPYPDREDDEIRLECRAGCRLDDEPVTRALAKGRHRIAQMELHAVGAEVIGDRRCHVGVERWQDLIRLLDDRHFQPSTGEVLGHLQSDEPAAHDDGATGLLDGPANPAAVGDGAHHEDAGKIDTRKRRSDRGGAGGQNQRIVALAPELSGAEIANVDPLGRPVDRRDLRLRVHLDVEAFPKELRRRDQQLLFLADHVSHVVGQPAVGEGHVRPAVEEDDFAAFAQAARSRRARGSSGHTAHDQDALLFHGGGFRKPCASAAGRVRGARFGAGRPSIPNREHALRPPAVLSPAMEGARVGRPRGAKGERMTSKPAVSLAAMPGRRRATIEVGQEIERKGFAGVYCPSFGDALALCEALALSTERIEIGTSIVNIYARHPYEYAQTAAFLHEMSGGRFRLGLGVSHESFNAAMGITPGKPLADMRRFVAQLRTGAKRYGELPPVVLATLRRPMVRLAAQIAQGAVWANAARSHMSESLAAIPGEQRAGGFFVGNMIPTCISDDRDAAMAVMRKTLLMYVRLPNYQRYWMEAGYVEEMQSIQAAVARKAESEILSSMTDRWLADVTLFGSVSQVREGVEAWYAAGVSTPILVPSSTSGGQMQALRELLDAFD